MLDLDYDPEEMESVYYINNDGGYDIRVLPVETGSNYTKWGVYKKVNNEIVTLEEHLFLWLTPVTSGSGQVALNNIMLRKRRVILGKE
ncbi:hypothetical protein [Liquorilactobacillus hordei]|uniref:Uncharacterized protein n=2 Tax=Liquorilactobacillus hordei TaxID=468911 RepID=A0A0R1MUG4_9LACO|nr:hypothetical protein [Liquorilactobacillus hordei]KRL07963.1 hypothetical protein FC92_GL001031 [Liquorilactobacillus hordei DSM 19519]QYH51093.1 hypothetical protein G6O70_00595 [Liquorilactobacillus hordei DSM 19519]